MSNHKRARKVRWFFLTVLLHALWYDLWLNRPLLRHLRPDALKRWVRIARRYRALALEMGGVLIKLGQFLSVRIDILPREITEELAGLQDQIPPEPIEAIHQAVEAAFGRPAAQVFPRISARPLGAASLAQAHRVHLTDGTAAVAKVLRPGIHRIVETDLAAIGMAITWLKRYEPIRRRVDIDWLIREFTTVTRGELDLMQEGRNAEALARDLEPEAGVFIPSIHWSCSAGGVLTMADAGFIKIDDLEGLSAAGISPAAVADRLYGTYMRQVFETYFVHADPHPGNLFVRPLPTESESRSGRTLFRPGEPVPPADDRPFEIVFIDFGMMVTVPERLRTALRTYAVGLGTRDAAKIVESFVQAGTLLPGADLDRLEAAHAAFLDRFWGVTVGNLKTTAQAEARAFLREFQDIVREAPFQFQVDMLFILRAVGMLSGLAARLDPEFDVWSRTLPYARRYAREALQQGPRHRLEEMAGGLRQLLQLPDQLHRVVKQTATRGLPVQSGWDETVHQRIAGLHRSVRRLERSVLAGSCLIAGAILLASHPEALSGRLLMAGAVIILIFRKGG